MAGILILGGLFLGGLEAVKAMGKRNLLCASDSIRPELLTAIGNSELTKEEAARWQDGWVKYQDAIYQYNEDILTFLIMGIDKNGDAAPVEEGTDGGQADALFLVVMNPKDGSVKIIGINRNTMADIDIYNGEGAYITTTKAQIAVQHGFGNGVEKSCEYQKKAVQKLFYNLPIHGYAAINMSAIPTINDSVGGINVMVLEDLTKIDSRFVEGSQIHLRGESAFWYGKYRDTDVFASADMRLERQRQYLTGFIHTAEREIENNISVALDLYNAISLQMVTDISLDEAAYLASLLPDYQFDENGFYLMEGETVKGEEFEEFYLDEDALYELILDVFYEKVE
ncbi:MAG: LCP family protein [Lachnospiraceae bacterium]|nr:LCP family protein [Lachnospiraceae bacterium]